MTALELTVTCILLLAICLLAGLTWRLEMSRGRALKEHTVAFFTVNRRRHIEAGCWICINREHEDAN